MAIQHLSEEQIQEWSLEQKDRWWLKNVFKGNMPQLTIRSALTGMLLGGVLSLTLPAFRRDAAIRLSRSK